MAAHRLFLGTNGQTLSPPAIARLAEQSRLLKMDGLVQDMAVQVVTDEYPRGLVKTIPTTKGVVKLLMQKPAEDAT